MEECAYRVRAGVWPEFNILGKPMNEPRYLIRHTPRGWMIEERTDSRWNKSLMIGVVADSKGEALFYSSMHCAEVAAATMLRDFRRHGIRPKLTFSPRPFGENE